MEDSPNIDALTPKNLKKRFKIPSLKFRFSGKIGLLIGILAIVVLIYNSFLKYVKPNDYGIKQVKIGIGANRGIQKEYRGRRKRRDQ